MTKIRIIKNAGDRTVGAEFEIDEQVARQLVGEGIAELVVEEPPERVTSDVKTKKRK